MTTWFAQAAGAAPSLAWNDAPDGSGNALTWGNQVAGDLLDSNGHGIGLTSDPLVYVTGTGTFDASYLEPLGAAEQLATDQAAALAAAASVKDDATILGQAGTYDFTAAIAAGNAAGHDAGEAEQLAADRAEVLAAVATIKDDATILGQGGAYDFTAAIAAGNAAGQAAKYAEDQAAVLASAEWIVTGHPILGVGGLFSSEDLPVEIKADLQPIYAIARLQLLRMLTPGAGHPDWDTNSVDQALKWATLMNAIIADGQVAEAP